MPNRYRRVAGVYCIYCMINKKRYIGSSLCIGKRIANHRNRLRAGKHSNKLLQSDWSSFGEHSFIISHLEYCSPEELETKESYWVEFFKTKMEDYGYNIVDPLTHKSSVEEGFNKDLKRDLKMVVVINSSTGEVHESTTLQVCEDIGVRYTRLLDVIRYWQDKPGKRSHKGYIFVYKEDYKEGFDYINYKKTPKIREKKPPKEKIKKEPKPYSERNIFRRPVVIVNIETGEETEFPSVNSCIKDGGLTKDKVSKCLRNDFGRYKHKGYFIKYKEVEDSL